MGKSSLGGSLKALATSDWHLCGMNNSLGSKATEWQFREINKVYTHAAENGFEHVFVPGDMSDIPTLGEDELIALMSHLLAWDDTVNTYYLLGNHDIADKYTTSMKVLQVLVDAGVFKNFRLFSKPEQVKIGGIKCSFLPYPYNKLAKDDTPEVGRLILAHLEAAGAIGDNGRPLKHGNEDAVKRNRRDYVVSGHIHKHQVLKERRFLYVGTLYQKNFGEDLPKGFIELKVKIGDEGKLNLSHTFVNSRPNFILENLLIRSQEDFGKLKQDPKIRYKIWIDKEAGILIPKGLTSEFPNIVSFTGIKVKGNTENAIAESSKVGVGAVLKELPKFNPLRGLKKFLIKNERLDEKVAKRGVDFVKQALSECGYSVEN